WAGAGYARWRRAPPRPHPLARARCAWLPARIPEADAAARPSADRGRSGTRWGPHKSAPGRAWPACPSSSARNPARSGSRGSRPSPPAPWARARPKAAPTWPAAPPQPCRNWAAAPLRTLVVLGRRMVARRARPLGVVGRRPNPGPVAGQAVHDAQHRFVAHTLAARARLVETAVLGPRIEADRMAAHALGLVP